jgi:hypothetical protein
VIYGALIVAGILVLANRRVRIDQLAKNSSWIILLFLYEGISCVWSDFPFICRAMDRGLTLRSAVGQTWPKKEIIVVNDGSADTTLDIA